MYLHILLVACPFKLLTQSLYMWNHYGKLLVTVVVVGPIIVVVVVLTVLNLIHCWCNACAQNYVDVC